MNLVIARAEYIEKVAFVRAATACWREGGTICCQVEMKLALSKMESVQESWMDVEEEKPSPSFPHHLQQSQVLKKHLWFEQ